MDFSDPQVFKTFQEVLNKLREVWCEIKNQGNKTKQQGGKFEGPF